VLNRLAWVDKEDFVSKNLLFHSGVSQRKNMLVSFSFVYGVCAWICFQLEYLLLANGVFNTRWIVVPRNHIMYYMMFKVCEPLQETITTKLHPRRHGRRSCGKLFISCHQCNLYSRCWLGSSFVPGNLISDEMIEFREGLFAFRTSFFVRTSSFL